MSFIEDQLRLQSSGSSLGSPSPGEQFEVTEEIEKYSAEDAAVRTDVPRRHRATHVGDSKLPLSTFDHIAGTFDPF
jgi:hypothetical protein